MNTHNEPDWENEPFPDYTEDQIAEIVRRSPTTDVAADLGINPRDPHTGRSACPWCRAAAFTIHPDGSWTCYACAEAGRNAVILVCKMRGLWRPDAVRWLEDRLEGSA
jgi:hypothetical protein